MLDGGLTNGQFDLDAHSWSEKFSLDVEDLQEEVLKQPSNFSYYAVRAARAKEQEELAKVELKRIEAQVFLEKINAVVGYSKDGIPKNPTVSQAEHMVTIDPRHVEAQNRYLSAKGTADLYRTDADACAVKGDMLRLLSFNIKRELEQKDSIGA